MTQSHTDVIVIGGGIVGAASAYYLSRRGLRVTLLEARDLAHGATGRNLGYIWLHSRRRGPELSLALATRKFLNQLPEELDYDFELQCNGGMIFFNTEEQARLLGELVRQRNIDGVEMHLVDRQQARELAPLLPETVLGATYSPLDAQVNPVAYVRAYAAAARRLGADVRVGTPVQRVLHSHGRVTGVETSEGRLLAGTVVMATGAWTPELARSLGLNVPIFPMRLQILASAPMPPMLDKLVYGAVAVKQYKIVQELPGYNEADFAADYEAEYGMLLLEAVCQTRSGQILMGCSMDYPGFVWEPDLRGISLIARAMLQDFPALQQARFERAWAGLLPYTHDNLPIIDYVPDYEGLMVAAGHVFGNAAGPVTGVLVSQMITGAPTTLDVAPFSFGRRSLQGADGESNW
jgi:glycine/D-amino acid oxidase-like deaminating enzyme